MPAHWTGSLLVLLFADPLVDVVAHPKSAPAAAATRIPLAVMSSLLCRRSTPERIDALEQALLDVRRDRFGAQPGVPQIVHHARVLRPGASEALADAHED